MPVVKDQKSRGSYFLIKEAKEIWHLNAVSIRETAIKNIDWVIWGNLKMDSIFEITLYQCYIS